MTRTPPSPKSNPDDIGRALRLLMLTTPADKIGIQPSDTFPRVYGATMDWPIGDVIATVVALADGNASLYTSSTFGIIGGVGHESVRDAAARFVTVAQRHYDGASPTDDYPYPPPGCVRFYLVGFQGVRVLEGDEAALKSGRHPLCDMWIEAQSVVTALREVTEKTDKRP